MTRLREEIVKSTERDFDAHSQASNMEYLEEKFGYDLDDPTTLEQLGLY